MGSINPEPCYFTCTLSQAAEWKKCTGVPSFSTVLDLIDGQARLIPYLPALGVASFLSTTGADDGGTAMTFEQLRNLSYYNIATLKSGLETVGVNTPDEQDASPKVIGVLSASDVNFVATWLGLTRLGYTVFFLAPQLDVTAIQHLCKKSEIKAIFADKTQLNKAKPLESTIGILPMPPTPSPESITQNLQTSPQKTLSSSPPPTTNPHRKHDDADDIPYIMHTSGTSSGLTSPIPQTHRGAVGVVPRLNLPQQQPPSDSQFPPTFTTTPLYHGGLADCFRAWCSGACIYLFPEAECPLTASNITRAVSSSFSSAGSMYFSSVPYVLQLLASDSTGRGLQMLRSMALVGVGGAALPDAVGDQLVHGRERVKLVSRLGSAECGFLLCSSPEDYDRGSYFRFGKREEGFLELEPRSDIGDDAIAELVVKKEWPLRLKVNRQDGSFATSDLFRRHPEIEGLWRYQGRADGMVTLVTGKKFDPGVLEDGILAGCPSRDVIRDVLVFGSGKPVAGALLFSAPGKGERLIEEVWPVIERLNSSWPRHAMLSKSSLVVVPETEWAFDGKEQPLERSSKGTVIRAKVNKQYAHLIESACREADISSSPLEISDADLPNAISEAINDVLGRTVDMDRDLFEQGVDSIACIQLRRMLQAKFILTDKRDALPMNFIYDCGTVNRLVSYILRSRQDVQQQDAADARSHTTKQHQMMQNLANKYSQRIRNWPYALSPKSRVDQNMEKPVLKDSINDGESLVVILTGATGALGSHILHQLLADTRVQRVLCLVRDKNPEVAHRRVSKALSSRLLSHPVAVGDTKIKCVPYNLSANDEELATWTDDLKMSMPNALAGGPATKLVFIHAAWPVNFTLSLSSFERLIASTAALLNLSLAMDGHFHFISSTAAVMASTNLETESSLIKELESTDPGDASALGYSRSKWVAENICAHAARHHRGHVSILRLGQLCGDESNGIWNMSEAFPLMFSGAKITARLPRLDVPVDWLPVDRAASAVLDVATPRLLTGEETRSIPDGHSPVFHILNPHQSPTWSQMIHWIVASEKKEGNEMEMVSGPEWINRLKKALESGLVPPDHPCRSLMGFWETMFTAGETTRDDEKKAGRAPRFDVSQTQESSDTMKGIRPLECDQLLRMWKWVETCMG